MSLNPASIRVVMSPYYPENPYQTMLCDALRRQGCLVKAYMPGHKFPRLKRLASENRANILHLHWLHHFYMKPTFIKTLCCGILFLTDLWMLRKAKIKLIWTIHNILHHERSHVVLDYIFRFMVARLADALICHSQSGKKRLQNFYRIPPSKPFYVVSHPHYAPFYPNQSTQASARRELGIDEDEFVFLFLGLIRPYKGVYELLCAYEKFKQKVPQKTRLLIFGGHFPGQFYEKIEKKSAEIPSVVLGDHVANEKIHVYMNAANAVVFPYKDVLTSGAALLALTFSKTVLAPKRGDFIELLNDETSFLYDSSSPDGLLDGLFRIYENRERLASIGQKAFEGIRHLTPELMAQKKRKIYEEILSSGKI